MQRVQIVTDLSLDKDTAARLIEQAHNKPIAPQPAADAGSAAVTVAAAPVTSKIEAITTGLPVMSGSTNASAQVAAVVSVPPAASAPDITFEVRNGGLYENLFRLTSQTKWSAPLWDLGEQDRLVQGGYTVTGASPEEVLSNFLQPYAENYRFNVQISPLERKVWLH
jgi:hypothetical protein